MSRRRGGRRRGRGQALVEFALILPLFGLIVLALFDVGSAVFSYSSVTNAAREGARLAIVNQDVASVQTRALDQITVAQSSRSVTVGFFQSNADGTPNTGDPCAAPVAAGCLAIVTYKSTYTPITPIIGSLFFPKGITFEAKSVMMVEASCPNALILTASACLKQP